MSATMTMTMAPPMPMRLSMAMPLSPIPAPTPPTTTILDVLSNEVIALALYTVVDANNAHRDLSRLTRTCRGAHEALAGLLFKRVKVDMARLSGSGEKGVGGVAALREEARYCVRSLSVTHTHWLRPEDNQTILDHLPLFPSLRTLTLPALNLLPPTLHPSLSTLTNLTSLTITINSNTISYFIASFPRLSKVTLDISGGRFTPKVGYVAVPFVPQPDICPSMGVRDVVLLSDKQHSYAPFEIDQYFPKAENVVIYAERGYHGGTLEAYLPILRRLPYLTSLTILDGRRFGHCSCHGANGSPPNLAHLLASAQILAGSTYLQKMTLGCAVDSTVGSGYWEMKKLSVSLLDTDGMGEMEVNQETLGWTKDRKFWERSGLVRL